MSAASRVAYHVPMKRCTVLVAVVAVALATAGWAQEAPPPFPNLEFRTLTMDRTFDLESLRGSPVLITFWASWCGPCRVELPELEELHEELGPEGFELVTVNMDHYTAQAQRFLAAMKLDIPTYRIHPKQMMELGVNAIPTSVLIGPDGEVAGLYEGYAPGVVKEVRRRVLEMLGEPETAAPDRDGES